MLTSDDKKEIRSIVSDELQKQFKPNGKTQKQVVDIVKDCMEQLFKTLWNKRTSWRGDIKGK